MPVRRAQAKWNGDLQSGAGTMRFGSGAFEGAYSFSSRFEDGSGTNPEELIAAAHAGCYSMALAGALGRQGHQPEDVETTASVHLEKGDAGFAIAKVHLDCVARVPGIEQSVFAEMAEATKSACPVSKALAVEITLDARLAND